VAFGITQELTDIPADQTLTVIEPPKLENPRAGQDGFQFMIRAASKLKVQTSTDLASWSDFTELTNLSHLVPFSVPFVPSSRQYFRVRAD
jgi:hypothetical protein